LTERPTCLRLRAWDRADSEIEREKGRAHGLGCGCLLGWAAGMELGLRLGPGVRERLAGHQRVRASGLVSGPREK
jgi:hypothetical protein